jgi:hypothetical protein
VGAWHGRPVVRVHVHLDISRSYYSYPQKESLSVLPARAWQRDLSDRETNKERERVQEREREFKREREFEREREQEGESKRRVRERERRERRRAFERKERKKKSVRERERERERERRKKEKCENERVQDTTQRVQKPSWSRIPIQRRRRSHTSAR